MFYLNIGDTCNEVISKTETHKVLEKEGLKIMCYEEGIEDGFDNILTDEAMQELGKQMSAKLIYAEIKDTLKEEDMKYFKKVPFIYIDGDKTLKAYVNKSCIIIQDGNKKYVLPEQTFNKLFKK